MPKQRAMIGQPRSKRAVRSTGMLLPFVLDEGVRVDEFIFEDLVRFFAVMSLLDIEPLLDMVPLVCPAVLLPAAGMVDPD